MPVGCSDKVILQTIKIMEKFEPKGYSTIEDDQKRLKTIMDVSRNISGTPSWEYRIGEFNEEKLKSLKECESRGQLISEKFRLFFEQAFPRTDSDVRNYIGLEANQDGFGAIGAAWLLIILAKFYNPFPIIIHPEYKACNFTFLLNETDDKNKVRFYYSYLIYEFNSRHKNVEVVAKSIFTGTIRKEEKEVVFVPENFEIIPYKKSFIDDLYDIVNNHPRIFFSEPLKDIQKYSIWNYVLLLLCVFVNSFCKTPRPDQEEVETREFKGSSQTPFPT